MAEGGRLVTAGRVGRPHGLDGSFAVLELQAELEPGSTVTVAGSERRIEHRAGSEHRPLLRLEGVQDRATAAALGGELLLVSEADVPLADSEWLADDLIGCTVAELGVVCAVLPAPSCDVLELGDGTLVPLIADAVRDVDIGARRIEVDLGFLGLGGDR